MDILNLNYTPIEKPFGLYRLAVKTLGKAQVKDIVRQERKISPLRSTRYLFTGRLGLLVGALMLGVVFNRGGDMLLTLAPALSLIGVLSVGLLIFGRYEIRAQHLASAHLRAQLKNTTRYEIEALQDGPIFQGRSSSHYVMKDIAARNAQRHEQEHQRSSPIRLSGGIQEI